MMKWGRTDPGMLPAGPAHQACGMPGTQPSLSSALPLPQPLTTGGVCQTGSARRAWGGEGSPGHLSQTLGHGTGDTVSRGGQGPSHETFTLGESEGGVMFHCSMLGKGR